MTPTENHATEVVVPVAEPFDKQKYLVDRAPPLANAAPEYVRALAMVSSEMGDPSVRPIEASIGQLANIEVLKQRAVDVGQARQLLELMAPGLEAIDNAQLAAPDCIFENELTIDALLTHCHAARQVARLTMLELYVAHMLETLPPAEKSIRRCLRLSRDLQPREPMVAQLVSMTVDAMVLEGTRELTLATPHLTAEFCDSLMQLLEEHRAAASGRYAEGLKVEYLILCNTIDEVASGKRSLHEALALGGVGNVAVPRGTTIDREMELAAANRLFGLALAEAESPYHRVKGQSAFRDAYDRAMSDARSSLTAGSFKAPVLTLTMIGGIDATYEAEVRTVTSLIGTQCLIAVRRYELEHGRLPGTLEEAVADTVLQDVPTDPYSGEKMRYAEINGAAVVYSTGKDLRDDGARADWNYGQQPGDYIFRLP